MKKSVIRALTLVLVLIFVFNAGSVAVNGPAGYKVYTPEEYYEKLEHIADLITELCYYSSENADPLRIGIALMGEISPTLYPSLKGAEKLDDAGFKAAVAEVLKTPEDFSIIANHVLAYDRYMGYVEPDNYDRVYDVVSTFVGIGITIQNVNGSNIVSQVYQHSPAKTAGLLIGDVFIEVEGTNVAGMSLDEFSAIMKGPEGSKVTVGIRRGSSPEILYFTMSRTAVVMNTAFGESLGDGVYLITISLFSGTDTIIDVVAALNEAKTAGATKLIIDLRDNHGGDLNALLYILNFFIKSADLEMFSVDFRGDETQRFYSTGSEFNFSKVIVLVNEASASAAEVMAGSLKDLGIAQIVGTKTYGKGMGQYHIELDDLDYAVITCFSITLPKTGVYDMKGLVPDYVVENRRVPYALPEFAALSGESAIYVGTASDDVLAVEQRLSALGYFTKSPDRTFDATSLAALNALRSRHGLSETNLCGSISLTLLKYDIAALEAGQTVDDLQMKKAVELAKAG